MVASAPSPVLPAARVLLLWSGNERNQEYFAAAHAYLGAIGGRGDEEAAP